MFTPPSARAPSTLVLAVLVASCSSPEVSPGSNVERDPGAPGSPGSGSGSGSPGNGSGGPRTPDIALPDAGAAAPPPSAPMQCAAEVHKAEVVPLDLLILLDASGSMTGMAGMRSKWVTAQSVLRSFIADPKSAGLGVGLQFFPQDKTCTSDRDCVASATTDGSYCKPQSICSAPGGPAADASSCGRSSGSIIIGPIGPPIGGGAQCPMGASCMPAGVCAGTGLNCTNLNQACSGGGGTCMPVAKSCTFASSLAECDQALYEKLAVPIGSLPMAAPSLVRSIMFKGPTGGTPMGPAVQGSLKVLRQHLAANPGRKAVLVLASDGVPSACGGGDIPTLENNLRMAYMGTPSIPTYVIGVFTQFELMRGQMTLDTLAAAGGSMKANVITANDDLTQKLLDAFNQIRGAALACEYKIPDQRTGAVDFKKVNLRYTAGGAPENLPYVERADRCDPMRGGWYYDVPPGQGTPTKIVVCDSTCQRFKVDKNAQVDLVFGCVTETIQ